MDEGLLLSGDTLFAAGWGRTDLPGGSEEAIAESLARLSELEPPTAVLPGHGADDDDRPRAGMAGTRPSDADAPDLAGGPQPAVKSLRYDRDVRWRRKPIDS